MRYFILAASVVALAACQPRVPDSAANVPDPGTGVGFGNYDEYRSDREAQLTGAQTPTTVTGPGSNAAIAPAPATAVGSAPNASEQTAAQQAAALNSGQAPLEASPSNPAPQIVANASGISGENDFNAVSAKRDIAADAALLEQNRARYQVIQPTELPTRSGTGRPNIVEYALRTSNPLGTPLYRRSGLRADARFQKSCGGFASPDLAQEEFLAMGGPERDRKGMDPDGDGFACGWNPAPFRAAKG